MKVYIIAHIVTLSFNLQHGQITPPYQGIIQSVQLQTLFLIILHAQTTRLMIRITNDFIDKPSVEAKASPRLRMNYNFHPRHEDPLHRMLNAMEPGTYIQPHKHENPDKFEVFLALRGRFVVFTFDNNGNIVEHAILDARQGKYGVEIPEKTYHTLLSLEEGSVAYEIKEGPYTVTTAKNFAPWAPAEGSPEVADYLNSLLTQVGITIK
jgi:cupin fold WbuC family metalloprotein